MLITDHPVDADQEDLLRAGAARTFVGPTSFEIVPGNVPLVETETQALEMGIAVQEQPAEKRLG